MSNDTALLVIDVQNGMFAQDDPVYQGAELLATIGELLAKARAAEVPVIYIQHNGWPIHPAIAPSEGDPVVRKATPDSFHETMLQAELEARGIVKLIVTGIQTEL